MRIQNRRLPRVSATIVLAVAASAFLAGCTEESLEEQSFVSLDHAGQWIVDHKCDSVGARQGHFGVSMDGLPMQMTFACDNGAKFDVHQLTDGTFRAKPLDP